MLPDLTPTTPGPPKKRAAVGAGKKTPKKATPKRAKPREAAEIASVLGGVKREKRGNWKRICTRRYYNHDLVVAGDFRFPSEKATESQQRALDDLIQKYFMYTFLYTCQGWTNEALAKAMNISRPTLAEINADFNAQGKRGLAPDPQLIVTTLLGMKSGVLAGPRGYGHTKNVERLFMMVDGFNLSDIRDSFPLRGQLRLLLAAFRLAYTTWKKTGERQ